MFAKQWFERDRDEESSEGIADDSKSFSFNEKLPYSLVG